jgi:hypothetical protein
MTVITTPEQYKAGIINDRRNISSLIIIYLKLKYKQPLQVIPTQIIIKEFKEWVTLIKRKRPDFGGPDGFESVDSRIKSSIHIYFRYKSLESEYNALKQSLKITESELSKQFGYKTTLSWYNSVNRPRRVIDLVIYWRVFRSYAEAKRV